MAPHATGERASGQEASFVESQLLCNGSVSVRDDLIEPIAVIGYSFGFPQDATDSVAFWDLLMEKRNTATSFPANRMNNDAMYHPDVNRRGQIPVSQSHFLRQDLASFDAPFFGISSTDAAVMDPQQRLLLEYSYRALENGKQRSLQLTTGLPIEAVVGTKTSVYTGVFSNDWQHLAYKDGEQCGTTTALGVQACFNANRISWFFNFTGNSANIDTACSSSLVCLDLGCQGLRTGEDNMSIVAGCNVILSPDNMHGLTNLNMLSPNGQCYSFDSRGNGYSRGEGFGVMVLKRVSDAIRDGDTIRGVIRSTGSNQNGHTSGITLPSNTAQERLIRDTYRKAGLSMEPTRFFEAHGTGTLVGDPIESKAIGSAFRHARSTRDPLWVGAVKSNVGHLEGASGIVGVIKALLVLEKGVIPPNTNFETINQKIDTEFLRLQFPLEAMPWPTAGLRRASVNSFGNAGTNAHAVLDDAYHFMKARGLAAHHHTVCNPPSPLEMQEPLRHDGNRVSSGSAVTSDGECDRHRLLLISSHDEAGPRRQAEAYASYYTRRPLAPDAADGYLDKLAFTLSSKRSALPWKSFAVVSSTNELPRLDKLLSPPKKSRANPGLGFIFTGQGAQWAAMGSQLMTLPAFKESVLRSEKSLQDLGAPWRLCEEIFQKKKSRINSPEIAQPATTAIQIALLDYLASVNVYPRAVIGHSSGEIAAAYSTGAISVLSALRLAYYRGVFSASLSESHSVRGSMMAVSLSPEAVMPYIDRAVSQKGHCGLTVACINSFKSVTVSGDEDQLDDLRDLLESEKVPARKLHVSVAYHSSHMQTVVDRYSRSIQGLNSGPKSPKPVSMFSSVTGNRVDPEKLATPDYWVTNMLSPVNFLGAMTDMLLKGASRTRKKLDLSHRSHFEIGLLVEIGPHAALRGPTEDIMTNLQGLSSIEYTSLLVRKQPADISAMTALGHIKCSGYPLDLNQINRPLPWSQSQMHSLHDLPGYEFNHSKQYWDESRICANYRLQPHRKLDLLGKPVMDWNPMEPAWRNFLRVSEMPWMEDHVINSSMIYPGAGMLVMAIEAAKQITESEESAVGVELKDSYFIKPLRISNDTRGTETRLSISMPQVSPGSKPLTQWATFRLFSFDQENWEECCHGNVRVRYQTEPNQVDDQTQQDQDLGLLSGLSKSVGQACQTPLSSEELYEGFNKSGLGLGPSFQRVIAGFHDGLEQVQGIIRPFLWPEKEFPQPHVVHPTSLDAMLHIAIAGYSQGGRKTLATMVPSFLRSLFVSKTGLSYPDSTEIHESAWLRSEDTRASRCGGFALDQSQRKLLMRFEDLVLTKVAESQIKVEDEGGLEAAKLSYHITHKADPDFLTTEESRERALGSSVMLLQHYVDLLAHKNPDLRILRIGTGPDDLVTSLFQTLLVRDEDSKIVSARYGSFELATFSKDALPRMQEQFQDHPCVIVRAIDPEHSFTAEMQKGKLYDIVLVSNNATMNDTQCLNIQKLLQADGRLIIHEAVPAKQPQLTEFLGSMALSASSQDYPAVSRFMLYSHASSRSPDVTVLVRQMHNGTPPRTEIPKVVLVVDPTSVQQKQTSRALATRLSSRSVSVDVLDLEDASNAPQPEQLLFIFLLDFGSPFLYALTEHSFVSLKRLLTAAHHVLWVNDCGGSASGKPESAVITGLARALQNEYRDLHITILSLESSGALNDDQLEKIMTILKRNHITPSSSQETEFLEINTLLSIPRITPAIDVTRQFQGRAMQQRPALTQVHNAPPLKLAIGSPGLLDTLHFIEDDGAMQPLEPDEVEIQTHAIGINYKDLLVAMGQLPSASMGLECAGIVRRCGPDTNLQPGDRVVVGSPETFKTHARTRAQQALKIPGTLPLTIAACIPAQFGTAWAVIHHVARLQEGESVLIHAAAGGTGQAAVQLAQQIGAIVFATVSSRKKKDLLIEHYAIPAAHIFYSRDTSFAQGVKRLTAGRGVDVVINSLVGEALVASWECIAPCGRFVEIGKKDILSNAALPMWAFRNSASFMAFDGAVWFQERPSEARKSLETLVNMFADGALHLPRPFKVYDICEAEKAFRDLQRGDSPGKFVVSIESSSRVSTILDVRSSFTLPSDATYVIAGGLGGIGRATARWLVDRGAHNLILLSRSGPRTDDARALLSELTDRGIRVETPTCDVTETYTMQETFACLSSTMPPIRGCFQMSLVPRDCMFANMTYNNWKAAVECKSLGSWNLHTLLPSDLDFFVLLSSASGLAGYRGQTNYDAGNTYEDALARYRVSRGQRAIALDLGAMVDDGFLAENRDLLDRVLGYGTLEPISRRKFHGILDYCCDPGTPLLKPEESQIAVGMGAGGGEGLDSLDYSRQPMMLPLRLAGSRQAAAAATAGSGGSGVDSVNAKVRFAASKSREQAIDIVVQAVVAKLGKSIAVMQEGKPDLHKPLQMYGVDSLLAIELRNWIVREFAADVAVFETQGVSTLSTLSMLVVGRSGIKHERWAH